MTFGRRKSYCLNLSCKPTSVQASAFILLSTEGAPNKMMVNIFSTITISNSLDSVYLPHLFYFMLKNGGLRGVFFVLVCLVFFNLLVYQKIRVYMYRNSFLQLKHSYCFLFHFFHSLSSSFKFFSVMKLPCTGLNSQARKAGNQFVPFLNLE